MRKAVSWVPGAGLARLAGMVFVGLVFAGGASAHPHVWIDARAEFVLDGQQRIAALRVSWRFDEFYSLFAIEGLDKNGDGTVDDEELKPLAELNVTNLKEYRYFTQITVDGTAAAYGPVTDFGSTLVDGILGLDFVIPLETPVDPRVVRVSLKSYDPTFYIAIEPPLTEPVTFAGEPPSGCRVDEVDGESAEMLTLSESDFLDPNANEGLGALYATEFIIACDGSGAIQ